MTTIPGDAAKQMFEKARLPNELLGRVWNLADTEQRGALGMTEFVVAMHLLASLRTGALRALPQTLPAGLYEAAARRAPPAPVQAIPRQFTGQQAPRPQSPLSRPPYIPPPMSAQPLSQQPTGAQPLSAQATGADWLITPQDKASFDKMFASIDRNNSGYIDGEQAVPFLSNSGLSEYALATIWDLSDINSEGRLSRDEFAIAMYLIRQQRGKVDGRVNLPTTLPAGLVPPSMRKQPMMPSQPTAPAFDNSVFATQQPKSASDDLFGLDALAASPEPTPAPQIQAIQPMAPTPASPQTATANSSPRQPVTTAFKPFMPTSSFGQGLTTQNTGGSIQSNISSNRALPNVQAARAPSGALDDLLGDNDPVVSSRLTDETSELGNMSNQIGTLRNQMQEVQNKKISTGSELSATSTQKRELEARLGQFRSQYEQEVMEVKNFEQQLNTVRNDTKRLQQELAMLEGTQADLQTQYSQVSAALDADQRENTTLKERVRVVNESIAQLKPQLEKLRSDARQQKGLVAINKKQVATSEGERDKASGEMSDLQRKIAERQEEERLEKERIEREHRETTERLRVESEQNREVTERLRTEGAQHREAVEGLRIEREQFAREKADFEREREQKAVTEKERVDRERAETERSFAAPQPTQQTIPTVVSPSTTASSKNPFFRRSPEPQADRAMSPSIFAEGSGPESSHTDAFDSFFGPSKASPNTGPPPTSFRNNVQASSSSPQSDDRGMSGFDSSFSQGSQHDEPNVSSEHRQMNSGNLPLRGLARADSFSSSLRANPPASSFGVSGHASPHDEPGSPAESYGDGRESYRHHGAPSAITDFSDDHTATGLGSGVAKSNASEHETQTRETNSSPATSAAPTGLFATIASFIPGTQSHADTARATSPEHHTALETIASYIPGTQANAEAKAAAEHLDSPNTETSHDEQFESINTSGQSTSQPSTFRKDEFPPIRELDDDDSGSDDGFEHDFATAFPNTNTSRRGGADEHSVASGSLSHAAGKQPARGTTSDEAIEREAPPPAASDQRSPPTYDQTVSPGGNTHDREANQFPREFDGLLPSREMVSSPPATTSGVDASQIPKQNLSPNVSQFEVPTTSSFGQNPSSSSYGHSSSAPDYESARGSNQQSSIFNSTTLPIGHDAVVPQAQEPGSDEFDSAFDDLSEAREFDEPAHESHSFSRAQTEEPEFTPEFDSPASASRTAMGDSFHANSSPFQIPSSQPDGFIKVKHFTSFGAAVPSPVTPYAPSNSQQSPTASSFPNAPQPTGSSSFSSSQQPVPGPPSFTSLQHTTGGPPSFSSYAPYAEASSGSSARNAGGFSSFEDRQTGPSQMQSSQQAPPQGSHNDDWDELFSGLDNGSNVGSSAQQQHSNGVTSSDPFAFDAFESGPSSSQNQRTYDAPPASASTQRVISPPSARQAFAPPPGPPPFSETQQHRAPPLSSSDRYAPPSAFAAPAPTLPNRPQPGRALSAGTEHDDPILKSLTGMGYDRNDALKALEKYDYNIDAVSILSFLV